MLKKIYKYLLVTAFSALLCMPAIAQSVIITTISVNNVLLENAEQADIVLGSKDTLAFEYKLDDGNKKIDDAYMYKIVLQNASDSSIRTTGMLNCTYANMAEGIYKFSVSAFNVKGSWNTAVETIKFRVNYREADLLKANKILQKEKAIADSTASAVINEFKGVNKFKTMNFYSLIAAGIIILVLIMYIIVNLLKFKRIKNENTNLKSLTSEQEILIKNAEEQANNANNEAEILQLKNKIENISSKVENISQFNSQISADIGSISMKHKELDGLQIQKNTVFSEILRGINDPTTAIKSLVDLLRSYDFSAFELKDVVENIVESTKKIIYMSEDIQRLIEFETTDIKLNFDTTSIKSVIDEAVAMNISDAKRKKITISINISPEVSDFVFDAQKVTIALHNLINNAVKYTPDGGKISIAAWLANHNLNFEIRDTGVGIDESELIASINKGEIDSSLNGKIGLLTVKKYVEAHNGKFWISSVLSRGSTFSFSLPEKA